MRNLRSAGFAFPTLTFLTPFTGSISASVVSGTVYDDPSHAPLAGVQVMFMTDKTLASDSSLTDSTGTFRFISPAGCGMGCEIQVRKEGYWMGDGYTFLLKAAEN